VKKTSLYLHETDVLRLRRLAEAEGRSQADIVRAAVAAYEARSARRVFALDGVWVGDGTSIADIPGAELLKGFGA
jgi:predicted transcriptional regulator